MHTPLYIPAATKRLHPGRFPGTGNVLNKPSNTITKSSLANPRQKPKNLTAEYIRVIEPALNTYPVAITTLGHFSLYKNGKMVNNGTNSQHKPTELLKLVIALGCRSIGEIRISDALWPDADGDVAHTSFSVTLHRIRKLLSSETLLLTDGHLSLNSEKCWVDVIMLEKTMARVKDAIHHSGTPQTAILELFNQALLLYQGPFLGNEDEQPWFIAYREKIKSKFVRCLINICDYLEHQGRCDLAIDYYHKGIEVEQLSEEFYLRLMKCYARQGRNVEAINVYLQCQRIFTALTGCNPSMETEKIFRKITQAAA